MANLFLNNKFYNLYIINLIKSEQIIPEAIINLLIEKI